MGNVSFLVQHQTLVVDSNVKEEDYEAEIVRFLGNILYQLATKNRPVLFSFTDIGHCCHCIIFYSLYFLNFMSLR